MPLFEKLSAVCQEVSPLPLQTEEFVLGEREPKTLVRFEKEPPLAQQCGRLLKWDVSDKNGNRTWEAASNNEIDIVKAD